jgi:hypothetical protein
MANGDNTVTFDVPAEAIGATTIGRFRLSTAGHLAPNGPAADGEVEDHQLEILNLSWHNFNNPFDVNGVDGVTPIDALLIINELTDRIFSDRMTGRLQEVAAPPPFLDVNNDGIAAPLDALLVINALPSQAPSAVATPPASADRFDTDRFAGRAQRPSQPSTAEVVAELFWPGEALRRTACGSARLAS